MARPMPDVADGMRRPNASPIRCRDQLQDFATLLEAHAAVHAGPLQGPHQPAAVVDLAVLGKEQACLPAGAHTCDLPLQARPVKGFAPGGGGVGVALGRRGEGHHDAADPQAAAQAAVGLDALHPGRNPLQAALAQLQQGPAQALGVGRQHAGRHKARGLIAAAAQHRDHPAAAGQPVGHGQPHQPAAQDQQGLGHREWGGRHGQPRPPPSSTPVRGKAIGPAP